MCAETVWEDFTCIAGVGLHGLVRIPMTVAHEVDLGRVGIVWKQLFPPLSVIIPFHLQESRAGPAESIFLVFIDGVSALADGTSDEARHGGDLYDRS